MSKINERYIYKQFEKSERYDLAADISTYLNKSFFEQYEFYLKSDRWNKKRKKILERDNYLCQSCLEEKATQVHHLTYDRVGCELASDLTSLCKKCHNDITLNSKTWRINLGVGTEMDRQIKKGVFGAMKEYLSNAGYDTSNINFFDLVESKEFGSVLQIHFGEQ